jgi:hypothetical protein
LVTSPFVHSFNYEALDRCLDSSRSNCRKKEQQTVNAKELKTEVQYTQYTKGYAKEKKNKWI